MEEAKISIAIGTAEDDDGVLDRSEVDAFLVSLNDLLRHADAPFRVGSAAVSYPARIFQKCENGDRVSTCYHVPRCGNQVPGNRLTEFGRWVQALSYTVSVTVPAGTDAGEPATAMAETLDIVRCTRPEWTVGDFELSAVDGESL